MQFTTWRLGDNEAKKKIIQLHAREIFTFFSFFISFIFFNSSSPHLQYIKNFYRECVRYYERVQMLLFIIFIFILIPKWISSTYFFYSFINFNYNINKKIKMSHCLGSFYTHLSKKNVHTAFIFIQFVRLKGFFVVFSFIIKSLQTRHQQRLLFFGQDYLITIIIIFKII